MRKILLIALLAAMLGVQAVKASTPSGWEVIYLYRDESVEANQAYQLSSLRTDDANDQPRPLHRFPINAISVPWDVPPPSAVSPDNKTLALIQWDDVQGAAMTIDLQSGAVHPLPAIVVKGLFDTTILGWTPDSAHLILYNSGVQGGQVQSYDVAHDTLTTLFTLSDVLNIGGQVTLSPDSARLIYCNKQGSGGCAGYAIRALDSSAALPVTLPSDMRCPGYPAIKWSADSKKIALDCFSGDKPGLTLIDATTGKVITYPVAQEINDLAWSADGSRLLLDLCAGNYVNADDPDCGALQYVNAATGTLTAGPAIERSEARRLFWLGSSLVIDESTASGQQSTLLFYDMQTKQSKQFSRNSSSYQDASFIVLGVRPVS